MSPRVSLLPPLLLTPVVLGVSVWVSAARLITGTAGSLSTIFACTITPVMVVLYLLCLWVPYRRGCSFPVSLRATGFLVASVVFALVFGVLCPDFGTPEAESMLVAWAGKSFTGFASATANPVGLLGLYFLMSATAFSLYDSRRRRAVDADISDGVRPGQPGNTTGQGVTAGAGSVSGVADDEPLMTPVPWLRHPEPELTDFEDEPLNSNGDER